MDEKQERLDNHIGDLEITEEIAHDFLDNKSDLTIEPLGEGSNNVNYLIKSEPNIVVKLSKPDFEYKAFSDYQKEEWCISKALELKIPSPKVLKLGKCGARAFLIESYIEGTPVANLDESSSFSDEEKIKVWKKLGEYTKRINSVPVTGWGENLVRDGVFDGTWNKHVQYNIESLNNEDILLSMEVIDKQSSEKIRKLFQSLQDKKFTFGLCHSDIALRNAMVDANGGVFLLDWGSARAEIVPHYELNEIIHASKPDPETLSAFLNGYGITQEQFIKMVPDLNALYLLNAIDTLRWAIDKRPKSVQEHTDKVKAAIDQIYK